jgi:prepilin-type N-terminal cleavage/methylation domain-containing protein
MPHPRTTSRLTHRAPGFTLIEIVLSLSVLGIVLAALGSVLGLTMRALPGRGEASEQTILASRALEQLTDDITSAKQIATTSTTLDLVIPDRDADGTDERVEYTWDGAEGSSLLRRLNDGGWTTALAKLKSINFAADRVASTIETASTPVEGSEQILSAWETGASATYSLSTAIWVSQTIIPVLPGDALSWRPTKIELNCRNVTPVDGVMVVDIRTLATDGTPSATSLGTATLNESSLNATFAWYTVTLPSISGQASGTGLAMLCRTSGSGVVAGRLQGATSGIAGPSVLHTSANGGTNWTTLADGAIYHRLWGVVTRPVTATSAVDRVSDIVVTLTLTDNKKLVTRVLTPAMPEAQ